jgi:hypothetical protein
VAFVKRMWGKWRPKKVVRQKTFHTIVAMDHQIRMATVYDGLKRLQQPFAHAERDPDPYSWPLATTVSDQGPDLVCAMGFLRRHPSTNLNLDVAWGLSHGCWNDLKSAIKHIGLWSHECLFICHYNMKYGCWAQDFQTRLVSHSWPRFCP